MDNRSIAQRLFERADQLDSEKGQVFHGRAYRRAAETVLSLDEQISDLVHRQGRPGLEQLPGIGRRISKAIADLVAQAENDAVRAR